MYCLDKAMEKICRLCIAESDNLTSLSEVREGLPISVIIMIIVPVKIELNDLLPKQVCDGCLEVVLNAYRLRDVSSNTERYLRGEIQAIEIDDSKVADDEFSTIENDVDDDDNDNKGPEMNSEIIIEQQEDDFTNYEAEEILESSAFIEIPNFKYKVDCQNTQTKKSAVWNYIGCLVDENNKLVDEERDYYFCKICVEENQTLKPKYKIESTATSVLFSHLNRVHGLNKSNMLEINPSFNSLHQFPELVNCEVCDKTFNSGSVNIHIGIEHVNGAMSRDCSKISQYKVNCFKTSSKSLAWDYFGALEDENGTQADQYYFYCKLCVEEDGKLNPKYTKNTSTSILLHHLKNTHIPKSPEEIAKRKLPDPITFNNKRLKNIDLNCKYCGENFEAKKSLNRHLAKEHNEEQPKNFICPVENCFKSFTMRDTLLKHVKHIHEGSKFPCNRCPTVLSTRMSLRRHIETCHFKLKSFACDMCNATYTEQKTLKNHMQKVHLGIVEKKIPCEQCELMFTNQWSLRRHMLTHTGEKPNKCHLCSDISYASKGDLTKHLTNVHNIAVYKCEFVNCSAGFRLRNDLREHYNKAHYQDDENESQNEDYEVLSEEFTE